MDAAIYKASACSNSKDPLNPEQSLKYGQF